ncbi:MAG: hypothetical protein LBP40_00370 [Campylobacteraceae bacterium]|jgi:hypothetical protein|nr:hypothetical protein [Campylobacteraceae bacterium]
MADYVIQGVPNEDGYLLATPIVDVGNDDSFKIQEVLDKDGKKIALPVANIGSLAENGSIVPPNIIVSGTTSTAQDNPVKVVDNLPPDYTPTDGDFLTLKFLTANTASNLRVSINGTAYYLRWRGSVITNAAYYTITVNQTMLVQFDGTSYNFVYTPDWVDDNNIYNQAIGINSFRVGAQITKRKLCMKAIDGKLYPLSIGDTTNPTKTTSTQIFDLSSPVLFNNSDNIFNANAAATNAFSYAVALSTSITQYIFNSFASSDFNKQLYLVGTIEGGGFKLDQTSPTSWYTTVIPTSADGKVYLPIGVVGDNANTFNLISGGTHMQYRNGIFAPVGFYGI